MRFPKQKVQITHEINDNLSRGDYFGVFKLKDKILDNSEELDKKVFGDLLSSTFIIGNFDDVVLIASELKKKGIETYDTLYYSLLALIANEDIYQAMSIIKKSIILNAAEVKELRLEGGANYTNILSYADNFPGFTLLLLIVNYLEGIIQESAGKIEVNREYLLFRFFDLINLVYELGYPLKIIQDLSAVMKIIFNLAV